MSARLRVVRRVQVLAAGPLSTVQDLGRPGWAHLGVPASGAADRTSFTLANRLVGNPETAAGIEVTMGGLQLRALGDLTVAVTGASCPLTVLQPGALPRNVPSRSVLRLVSGAVLRLGPAVTGVRAYLAVRGGIDVPAVLGSRSTDILSGLGPTVLRDGDLIDVGAQADGWPVVSVAPGADPAAADVRLHALPGPRDDVLGSAGRRALQRTRWLVSERSDRIGVRLIGPPLLTAAVDRPSEGVARGSIQLPPGGNPVLFLADHPATGGYPVIAVLTAADADRAAQLRPGQGLTLSLLPPEPL